MAVPLKVLVPVFCTLPVAPDEEIPAVEPIPNVDNALLVRVNIPAPEIIAPGSILVYPLTVNVLPEAIFMLEVFFIAHVLVDAIVVLPNV